MLHWADGRSCARGSSRTTRRSAGPTDPITLHRYSVPTTFPSLPGVSVFNDHNSYYVASDPADAIVTRGKPLPAVISVNNPHTGTTIQMKSLTPGGFMQVAVTPPK